MCSGGEALPSSLSVPRTLRSVLTGSLEPLGRITRMVCYMYYTDVFVGQDNIVKLKNALEAELKGSGLTVELTQLTDLASGLGFLAGLPACLCKTKKSVKEGLQKIYKELNKNISLISCDNLQLNCPSCVSKDFPCKCCVIQSINKVKGCQCLKTGGNKAQCHCNGKEVSCAQVLAGLEACLHLQCLQSDMEDICQCKAELKCCKSGKCDGTSPSCGFCKNLQTKTPQPTTGLGLSPPNPIRLAQRLDKFFGDNGPKGSCGCNSSPCTCCCLACQDCSASCNSECISSGCPHGSQGCPRKTFCLAINSIKVSSGSSLMRCCDSGKKCHCGLDPSSQCSGKCCKGSQHSVKCMIRRLVSYFKSLSSDPSQSEFSKKCCDLLCVVKTCEFLKMSYDNGKATEFKKHLEALKYSSPCGHDLWRTLKDFLYYCVHMVGAHVQSISGNINAAKQKCSQCPPTGRPQQHSCNNNCNGQCKGCKELLGDSHFMAILTRKFSSSYDSSNANWDSLCSKSGKCCGQPSCLQCSPPSSCPAGGCCEKCPKRLCAKIFLGILPCLYYGLKILYDRVQDPVTWPTWQKISMDFKGNPSSDLGRFLSALGYDLKNDLNVSLPGSEISSLLDPLFTSGILKSLYDASLEYFSKKYSGPTSTSFSSSLSHSDSKDPLTVRSMLLWLYGLRFHKHFPSLVSHCSSLCSPFGNSFHPDAVCYYLHLSCFLAPISIISFIETSDYTVANFFSDAQSEVSEFHYPSDPSELLEKLCEYVRKIYIPLKFLQYQCENGADKGGWASCTFGQKCAEKFQENSSPSGSFTSPSGSGCSSCSGHDTYLCTASANPDVHKEHCQNGQCLGSGPCTGKSASTSKHSSTKCKNPCPHPLLRFLLDGSSDPQSTSKDLKIFPTPFQPPKDFPPMGFKNLSPTAKSGYGLLHGAIICFCNSGFYPLTRLVQFAFWVSRYPETLGELFAFFFRFSESDVFKNFGDYVDGEPGFYPGRNFAATVRAFYGSEDSHKISSHPSDLRSLIACDGPKGSSNPTCGKYLHPLTYNAYHGFIEDFLDTYLSWVCHLAPKFQSELKRFHEEAQKKFKSCCSTGSCQKIVECPCALPFLYSFGFGFWSPKGLNCHGSSHTGQSPCTRKSCQNFVTQLGKVLEENSPLGLLIKAIDAFLWHIRLPFVYAFLYIWILVISYFYYVQFYKLDLLHIDSHLHLPRSFKILPSTLFSD
ncbi:variant erythrocyte surface antigen-1 family protein, partial [Babesia divergens]